MTRTYGTLRLVEDRFVLDDVEAHVAIHLKALFSRVPKAAKVISFPATPGAAADLAWFCQRYPMRGEPVDLAALEARKGQFETLHLQASELLSADYVPPPFAGVRAGQTVRPHQGRAAKLVELFGGLLVGDQTGKGKTYTAAAAMLIPGALPATVVCPPNLKRQWKQKVEAFTNLTCCVVSGGTPYPLPPADVRIFSYTILSGWADMLEHMGTGLVVFDEMHELRRGVGTDSEPVMKGQAAMRLANASAMRLGMTATPVFNYGSDIWEIMSFLRPEMLSDKHEFLREWCTPLGKGKWSVKDPAALGTYLRDQRAMVRELKDSPKPNVTVHQIAHDVDELASIDDLARALAIQATTGSFEQRGQATRQLDLMLRQKTGVAKARAVAAFVRLLVRGGTRLLLFGWHREVYDIWMSLLADLEPAMHTGSETPAEKERQRARFLNGDTDLMIVSLRSGAGLDGLQQACSTVVFGELDWSPAMHEQCIGRVDREGQPVWETGEGVNAIYLVTDDGSDPPIMQVLGLKASEAAHINDPSLGPVARVSDETKFKALVQRYLDKQEAA